LASPCVPDFAKTSAMRRSWSSAAVDVIMHDPGLTCWLAQPSSPRPCCCTGDRHLFRHANVAATTIIMSNDPAQDAGIVMRIHKARKSAMIHFLT